MRKAIISAVIAASLLIGTGAHAAESIVSDPSSDADCLVALLALADQADKEDEDAIFTMAIYYFGRLGGEGKADTAFLVSRMGRFADDESLFLTEAESCIADFEKEAKKFDELSKLLE